MGIYIIAEAGINHNGDLEIAKQMVRVAKSAGADCIKFQTFKAEEFISSSSQTYTYKSQGKEKTESMLEMFKRYEFSEEHWKDIVSYCKFCGIDFSSTAQNFSDFLFLNRIADLPFIKVGSDDLTNLQLLEKLAAYQKPMIISAGMAYASEIEDAVLALKKIGVSDITVLHCTSSYPTSAEEVNLLKIGAIRGAFDVKVGFSDHTVGATAAIGAVCYGVSVIEKHFTLSCDMEGPDHWFSVDEKGLSDYIQSIRFAESMQGRSTLVPTLKELEMREIARRKIVFSRDLCKGDIVTSSDVTFKRSNDKNGFAPKYLDFFVGRRLILDGKKGVALQMEMFRG